MLFVKKIDICIACDKNYDEKLIETLCTDIFHAYRNIYSFKAITATT